MVFYWKPHAKLIISFKTLIGKHSHLLLKLQRGFLSGDGLSFQGNVVVVHEVFLKDRVAEPLKAWPFSTMNRLWCVHIYYTMDISMLQINSTFTESLRHAVLIEICENAQF